MTDATRPRVSDDLLATACDIIEKTQHIVDENGTDAWLGLLRSCALDLRDERAESKRLQAHLTQAEAALREIDRTWHNDLMPGDAAVILVKIGRILQAWGMERMGFKRMTEVGKEKP